MTVDTGRIAYRNRMPLANRVTGWRFLLATAFLSFAAAVSAADAKGADKGTETAQAPSYRLDYVLELHPDKDLARLKMRIDRGEVVRQLSFRNPDQHFFDIQANGEVYLKGDEVWWDLPDGPALMTVSSRITHRRNAKGYDAMITPDWALFRGDDVVPPVSTKKELPNAEARAELTVVLPDKWKSVETGWPRLRGERFRVDNPERRFDRPTGWILAGRIGTRRDRIEDSSVAVSAPRGTSFQRMDALVFLNVVWPEARKAFQTMPEKLLIVGGDDPLWRGGLSASNSLYLHADRPLVSENGTSPMLHELVHMATRIRGKVDKASNDDWIAEGLAEYYSVELLHRAGGFGDKRRGQIIRRLDRWGKKVKQLRSGPSHGPVTARAVVWFNQLDQEIRKATRAQDSLDEVVRELMKKRKVSLEDLEQAAKQVAGKPLKVFDDALLRAPS